MWQKFYEKQKTNNFELLSVAADVQGALVVRPFVEKFGVTFPVAVDSGDTFGEWFGLKIVPVSFLIDELGIIRLADGGPSGEFLKQIESILDERTSPLASAPAPATPTETTGNGPEKGSAIAAGHLLLQEGKTNQAAAKLREALARDPSNWRIRKQIWAIENPDKFYAGESPDFGWQREQIKREEKAKKPPG